MPLESMSAFYDQDENSWLELRADLATRKQRAEERQTKQNGSGANS